MTTASAVPTMPSDDALRRMADDRGDDQSLAPAVNRLFVGLTLAGVASYSALGHLFHRLARNWSTVPGSAGPFGAAAVLLVFVAGLYLAASGLVSGVERATVG
jgi:uncharacterized protein (DUF2342 family)